nr:cytochrome B6 [Chloroflexota bacterium]
ALLAAATGGILDSGAVDAPGALYNNDHTKSLLNIADGGYLTGVGAYYGLAGEHWGVMNQIGNWPGQPWLWWYTMWYNVPGPIRAALGYSDLAAIAYALPLLALVFFLPFIPGLRSLPRSLRVHRLIWRDYYRAYGASKHT